MAVGVVVTVSVSGDKLLGSDDETVTGSTSVTVMGVDAVSYTHLTLPTKRIV